MRVLVGWNRLVSPGQGGSSFCKPLMIPSMTARRLGTESRPTSAMLSPLSVTYKQLVEFAHPEHTGKDVEDCVSYLSPCLQHAIHDQVDGFCSTAPVMNRRSITNRRLRHCLRGRNKLSPHQPAATGNILQCPEQGFRNLL